MPESHRGTYRRARGGKSLRAAVDAQCAECCGYDREAVRTCPAIACPLWRYRPWLLPILNAGRVELLDERRLVAQLLGLERRTARGGRDSID